jgi:hypothetical protein
MHNDYSEEHMKIQEFRRIEDFWDKQGKVIHGERSCCNYCSKKYVMACWDNHKVRMLACLQVLLHMEGSKEIWNVDYKTDKEACELLLSSAN